MSYRLSRYRVILVREGSCAADHNRIRTPEDVFAIMGAEYANAVVETAMMRALDTKNKVIAVFTVSTGSRCLGSRGDRERAVREYISVHHQPLRWRRRKWQYGIPFGVQDSPVNNRILY